MLGKKSKPVIAILTGSLLSGNRSGTVGIATRTHFESNPQSLRKFDLGAVGLSIVASLENDTRGEFPVTKHLFSRNLARSNPIPLPIKNRAALMELEEEYTVVTSHSQNQSYTRVYGDDKTPFRIQKNTINCKRSSVFKISPVDVGGGAPPPDFLSSCSMCQKNLHGKDIYMYRGEKAFCSTECRDRQIVMDERKEKCISSKTSINRRVDVSSSHCADNGKIFTIGIMAI